MRLPDGARSRAVLVGTSRYDDDDLPDLPSVVRNIDDLAAMLTNHRDGTGLPPEHCQPVVDAGSPADVWPVLHRAADEADDLLLVYYAGHGVLDRRGRLYLGLPRTTTGSSHWTALDVAHVREVMAESVARNRVLIVDCCFSGRAFEAMGVDSAAIGAAQVEIDGTYTLTSTSANAPAHSPIGHRYTAFTGALLDLFRYGVPDGPDLLTLDDIYHHLRRALRARNAPRPERKGTNNAGELALVRNRAPHPGGPATEQRLEEARTLLNDARSLGSQDRWEEALATYDRLIAGFGDDPTPAMRAIVAGALRDKAAGLERLDRWAEAQAGYDEMVSSYEKDSDPGVRAAIAGALNDRAGALCRRRQWAEALTVLERIGANYHGDASPDVRVQVAHSLQNKAWAHRELNDWKKALAAYDQVISTYGDDAAPALRQQVASALKSKAWTLAHWDGS